MWVINEKDGSQWWTIHENLADHMRSGLATVIEVVPASDLRASEELVQRLFDSLSYEIVRREAGESMSQETAKKMQAQAEDEIHESYGFRKVAGKWERVK